MLKKYLASHLIPLHYNLAIHSTITSVSVCVCVFVVVCVNVSL